jgi:hypothetical protein
MESIMESIVNGMTKRGERGVRRLLRQNPKRILSKRSGKASAGLGFVSLTDSLGRFRYPKPVRNHIEIRRLAGRRVIMPRPDAAAEVAADTATMAAFTPPSFTAGRSRGGR